MKIKKISNAVESTIELPSSKSESNRILIIQALSNAEEVSIQNLSESNDTLITNAILKNQDSVSLFDVGHAGTAMRFLTAYFALKTTRTITLQGSERMHLRPIKPLVDVLNNLGANVTYLNQNGYPPLQIEPIGQQKSLVEIDASISSQYVSALLMVAPLFPNGICLKLKGKRVSTPYIKLTIDLMQKFGVHTQINNDGYLVRNQSYKFQNLTVESDWSAASYWYQIAALSSSCCIILEGLHKKSSQGDQSVMEFFEQLGVESTWINDALKLTKKTIDYTSINLNFNLEPNPDLAQTLICTCAALNVNSKFSGLSTLKNKETDRLQALKNELLKFKVDLSIDDERAELKMLTKLQKPNESIRTYEDHRMAMCFAPLALVVDELTIEHPEVVEKSYPNFWKDIGKVFHLEK